MNTGVFQSNFNPPSPDSGNRPLRVLAVAQLPQVAQALTQTLQAMACVGQLTLVSELSEAHQWVTQTPADQAADAILVDLTGREYDGQLFIQAMSMDYNQPYVLFALHQQLDSAMILESVRHGAREFLQFPQDNAGLEKAMHKLHHFINRLSQNAQSQAAASLEKPLTHALPEEKPAQVMAVFAAKGGAGSSTVAVNLAHELLAETGDSVLLLDMDQVFNNTAVMLNLRPHHALGDLTQMNPEELTLEMLDNLLVAHESGLNLLVASKSILDDNDLISPELLLKTLSLLKERFVYIVLDLPTHVLDPYHQLLVEQADDVLVVSGLDVPGLYRTRQYLDLANRFLKPGTLKLVLNRWNLRAAYGMTNKNLEEEFRFPVYARLVNDWELNVEANSLGKVFSKLSPQAELSQNLTHLARRLAGLETEPQPEAEPNPSSRRLGGFLAKLFGGFAEAEVKKNKGLESRNTVFS